MTFATQIIAWQRLHGRHDLPWQHTRDPYRVWLSEIMLQQTQVSTVIEYYTRFLHHFPDVAQLAQASAQDVMAQWAGLGYYARARHLHACAKQVMERWAGRFPSDALSLTTLPGIGPSTAAAIAAFCYGERAPILDGNVKRVFSRYFAIEGDPTQRAIEVQMWALAHKNLPTQKFCSEHPDAMARYTQAQMDLGATLCARRRPKCEQCPIQKNCLARRTGRIDELPWPRARKVLPERAIGLIIAYQNNHVLLEQRPDSGIWGGLWSLPEFEVTVDPAHAGQKIGVDCQQPQSLTPFLHVFTHFRLSIQPWLLQVTTPEHRPHGLDTPPEPISTQRWVDCSTLGALGLPAPVRKLLEGLVTERLLSSQTL